MELTGDYLTLDELVRQLKVSYKTVQRWTRDLNNPLPTHSIQRGGRNRGRVLILRSEFEAWVKTFPPAGKLAERPTSTDMEARVAAAVRSMRG